MLLPLGGDERLEANCVASNVLSLGLDEWLNPDNPFNSSVVIDEEVDT